MPHRLYFCEDDLLLCRFAVSPLWETQEAVRTLVTPRRHGYHLPWLRHTRAAAAGLDLRPLWLLMAGHGYFPDWLGPPPISPAATFDEEIAQVRDADPDAARDQLARALATVPGAAGSAPGRALLADPARTVAELADLLRAAWQALVEPYWPRLRALLEADVSFRSRRLADAGLGTVLHELDPRLRWTAGTLSVGRHGAHSRQLDGRGLVLLPSAFSWPDVVSGFEAPWQPTLVYPARGIAALWAAPADHTSDALVSVLGRGRARVLTALDEPATTTSLADRLALAPSSVSAHLTALRSAGLLTARRHGHRVLYERTVLGGALLAGGV